MIRKPNHQLNSCTICYRSQPQPNLW